MWLLFSLFLIFVRIVGCVCFVGFLIFGFVVLGKGFYGGGEIGMRVLR